MEHEWLTWGSHPHYEGWFRNFHNEWYIGTCFWDDQAQVDSDGDVGGTPGTDRAEGTTQSEGEDLCWSGLLPEQFKSDPVPPLFSGLGSYGPDRFGVAADCESRWRWAEACFGLWTDRAGDGSRR